MLAAAKGLPAIVRNLLDRGLAHHGKDVAVVTGLDRLDLDQHRLLASQEHYALLTVVGPGNDRGDREHPSRYRDQPFTQAGRHAVEGFCGELCANVGAVQAVTDDPRLDVADERIPADHVGAGAMGDGSLQPVAIKAAVTFMCGNHEDHALAAGIADEFSGEGADGAGIQRRRGSHLLIRTRVAVGRLTARVVCSLGLIPSEAHLTQNGRHDGHLAFNKTRTRNPAGNCNLAKTPLQSTASLRAGPHRSSSICSTP